MTDIEVKRCGGCVTVEHAREMERKLNKAVALLTFYDGYVHGVDHRLQELSEQLSACQHDALRYLYLRSKRNSGDHRSTILGWIHVVQAFEGVGQVLTERECDLAVDAARLQEASQSREYERKSFDQPCDE